MSVEHHYYVRLNNVNPAILAHELVRRELTSAHPLIAPSKDSLVVHTSSEQAQKLEEYLKTTFGYITGYSLAGITNHTSVRPEGPVHPERALHCAYK